MPTNAEGAGAKNDDEVMASRDKDSGEEKMVYHNAKRRLFYDKVDTTTSASYLKQASSGHKHGIRASAVALEDHQVQVEDFLDVDHTVTEHDDDNSLAAVSSGYKNNSGQGIHHFTAQGRTANRESLV